MNRIALFGCIGMGGIANANILVNGGFEDMPNWGYGPAGDAFYTLLIGDMVPGWTIEAGYGATFHNSVAYPTITGEYSLNTDAEGYNGHNVNIYQDCASLAGEAYELSFDWLGWSPDSVTRLDVTLVDLVTETLLAEGNYDQGSALNHASFAFTGTGNVIRLRVKCAPESGRNDNAIIADNFTVAVVPTAGSITGLALGGVMFGRRRR